MRSRALYRCWSVRCINMACFIFLQAMGKAVESTALSMPLSDILTFLIAVYLIVKTYRSLEESHT